MGMLREALAPSSATARQPIVTATGRRMLSVITATTPSPAGEGSQGCRSRKCLHRGADFSD